MTSDQVALDAAQNMALIPLAWLAWRARRGQRVDRAYWILAAALGVSWIPDAVCFLWPDTGWLMANLYTITQATMVIAVFVGEPDRTYFLVTLVLVALAALALGSATRPDVLVPVVAWGAIVATLYHRPALGRLRIALMLYFGVGLATWIIHAGWLVEATWYPYQLSRLLGIGLFCWAIGRTAPPLTMSEAA